MHQKRKPTPLGQNPDPITGNDVLAGTNPTLEDAHWRQHFASRPYVRSGAAYAEYQPAYRLGWESRGRYGELNWETAEPRLREDWVRSHRQEPLDWDKAGPAVKDAWDRLNASYPNENI